MGGDFTYEMHEWEDRRAGKERRQEPRRGDDASAPPAPPAPATDPLDELRALAATVRQCQRNGHPHITVHLDALLKKLGA